jgi:hypothetical protein
VTEPNRDPLDELSRITAEVRALQDQGLGPAVDNSLQFCLHYLHLAHQFLGGTDLGADIDLGLEDE